MYRKGVKLSQWQREEAAKNQHTNSYNDTRLSDMERRALTVVMGDSWTGCIFRHVKKGYRRSQKLIMLKKGYETRNFDAKRLKYD